MALEKIDTSAATFIRLFVLKEVPTVKTPKHKFGMSLH
jgi:hypothetical protein